MCWRRSKILAPIQPSFMTHWQFSSSVKERAKKRMVLELAEPGAGEECGWSWLRKRESAVANYKVMSQNRGIDRLNQEASGIAILWWVWPYVARQRILKGPNVRLFEKSSETLVLREALAWSWMVLSSNLMIGYDSNLLVYPIEVWNYLQNWGRLSAHILIQLLSLLAVAGDATRETYTACHHVIPTIVDVATQCVLCVK